MSVSKKSYLAIGLMSGSSLDGLDMIAVKFDKRAKWTYNILSASFVEYEKVWKEKLKSAHLLKTEVYLQLDKKYGEWLGLQILDFIKNSKISEPVDLICSHGHTILHEPEKGITKALGNGQSIADVTHLSVVSDLREADVAAGGQGAPIIPIGEKYLFSEHNVFLNIGGIANISFHTKDNVIAYDVCPGNTPLNLLAQELGIPYDKGGELARSGSVDKKLLDMLNDFSFYKKKPPRSLHTHYIVDEFMPMLSRSKLDIEGKLATVCEHIAVQVAKSMTQNIDQFPKNSSMLITGGGALNSFLVERIRAHSSISIDIPEKQLIDYKEALVMAFFGVLRWRNESNCLRSVTGATKDVVGGNLYQ